MQTILLMVIILVILVILVVVVVVVVVTGVVTDSATDRKLDKYSRLSSAYTISNSSAFSMTLAGLARQRLHFLPS